MRTLRNLVFAYWPAFYVWPLLWNEDCALALKYVIIRRLLRHG